MSSMYLYLFIHNGIPSSLTDVVLVSLSKYLYLYLVYLFIYQEIRNSLTDVVLGSLFTHSKIRNSLTDVVHASLFLVITANVIL